MSSTFYIQLLCLQIQKAYKDTDDFPVFFTLLGSTSVKALRRTVVKLTQGLRGSAQLTYQVFDAIHVSVMIFDLYMEKYSAQGG